MELHSKLHVPNIAFDLLLPNKLKRRKLATYYECDRKYEMSKRTFLTAKFQKLIQRRNLLTCHQVLVNKCGGP